MNVRPIVYEKGTTKVYENANGTYQVVYVRNYSFDGWVEPTEFAETFDKDGMHSSGCVCTHNFPVRYADDGLTLKERAIKFAKGL